MEPRDSQRLTEPEGSRPSSALGPRHLRSIGELEELLDRFTPYGQTTTSIVHSSPVPRRGPPFDATR